jgi:signal transduction histidine kinase
VPRIQRARAAITEKWVLEKNTPVFPGERALWTDIESSLEAVDAAVKRVLAAPRAGDSPKDDLIYASLRPSVDNLAEALLVDLQFNAQHAEAIATKIAAARVHQRATGAVLAGVGAFSALLAGAVLAIALLSYMATTDARISELDLFAARVAHDVRSPLTYVAFSMEILRQRCALAQGDRTMLERAARAVQRIGQIIDALLLVAAANVAEMRDDRAEVRALATDEIEEILPEARKREVEVSLDLFDPVEVACSEGALACILSNLLGNALKYIGDSARRLIRVSAHASRDRVRLEVRDTGPGVPFDRRDRLFDPYVRAHSASIPGLGLGLATVRRLADAYGGRVGVEDNPGGGSCFWVELPRAAGAR